MNKLNTVNDLFLNNFDIFVVTESWHGSSDNLSLKLTLPPDFVFIDFLRPGDPHHGGIIMFFKKYFNFHRIPLPLFKTFEAIVVKFYFNKVSIVVFAIYRPGSSVPTPLFFDELSSVFDQILLLANYVIFVGDVNIHVELSNDPNAIKLLEIFDLYQLANRINEPTHVYGGTLDLIVSNVDLPPLFSSVEPPNVYSDHSLIKICFPISVPTPQIGWKLTRSWNRIDVNQFRSMVLNSSISGPFNLSSPDVLLDLFNSEIAKIVDVVAPCRYVKTTHVSSAPWFDSECRSLKRNCRKLERSYKKEKNDFSLNAWRVALKEKMQKFSEKRNGFWSNQVGLFKKHPKKLWGTLDKILSNNRNNNQSNEFSANDFVTFFVNKINDIRGMTVEDTRNPIQMDYVHNVALPDPIVYFSDFQACTSDELRKIVCESPSSSCSLDLIPTYIFKKFIDLFLPFLTFFVNQCLLTGSFPNHLKHAIITPLLKKSNLDNNVLSNYRPISNLSFISKVIERVVIKQLLQHLNNNNLLPKYQSGYRQYFSTETALIDICSQLFSSIDNQRVSFLVLLDMSAAFDCVDHTCLINKLSTHFFLSKSVLSWFSSYLLDRTQQVAYNNTLSDINKLTFGVPQGSVLGPLLFLMYTADVFDIIRRYEFNSHAFADDIQLLVSCPVDLIDASLTKLTDCLIEISTWMTLNRLKLNQSKTQILPVGSWQQLSKVRVSSISIGDDIIDFSTSVRSLGVIIDSNLHMNLHINHLVKVCSNQLRLLRNVRRSLNTSVLQCLVSSFVFSRIDYCNSLFYGVTKESFSRLQSIQNRAAKLVLGGSKFDHVTPLLSRLHWLKVDKRVLFKIAILMFKCVNNAAPPYLIEKLESYKSHFSKFSFRSTERNLFFIPTTKLVTGSRNFAVFGPVVWNGLPPNLRDPNLRYLQFRNQLKTYLFTQ